MNDMKTTTVLLSFVFVVYIDATIAQNACHDPYITINEVWRSTAYEVKPGQVMCDRNYIVDDSWYRFDSAVGSEMPTSNPGYKKCGTYVPIWMQGKHPTVAEGEIDAKACAGVPHRRPLGCGISYNIKVINCSGFYLYRLKRPRQCSLAYCAGDKKQVNCSHTGTRLPVCAGIVPNVKKIIANYLNEDKEFVRLKCEWEYDGNASLVEFHVRWIGDEYDNKRQINETFDGTDKKEYLYEFEYFEDRSERPNGYAFDKEAFCEIRSRYQGGSWSKWTRSNKLYTGISVHPKRINLDECGEEGYRKVFISLTPYLPIRKKPFKVDINLGNNQHKKDQVCLRGVESDKFCQMELNKKHSSTSPLRIMLRTSCSQFDSPGFSGIDVSFKYGVLGGNNKFWEYYNFPSIKIFITRSEKKICKSVTDPHFTTFDGRYFDFYGVGTFLLYHNKHIGTRVEARQKTCGGSASCNCGIAIKEGPFYKIFDMCQVDNTQDGTAWWQNPQNLVIRKRSLKESRTNGFFTEKTSDGKTSTTYKIYLPSGVMVTVERRYWGLSTHVKAPTPFSQGNKNTDHHSEGLCGNYNGNYDDDFVQGQEVQFAESHRIIGKSLFDYKGDKILEETVLEDCKTGEICSCKKDKATCGPKAIGACFPSEDGNDHTKVKAGLCESLAKRDLDSQDDDIDDEDDIPPFNPPQQNVTRVPTWPTPRGLTEVKVREICNAKIRYSKAGESCGNITGVDIDAVVGQCIADIQATDNEAWSTDNFAAMQETCKKNIYKNTSFYKNSTDGELKLDTKFLASLCPNDCSDHGNCSNSTCTCDEYYTASDCSISLKERPFVSGIRKAGLCDVRRRPCRNVGIYGFPFLDSKNLTCHVQEFKVIESVWSPNNSISLHPGRLVDLTEVKCSLPQSPVNIGDYSSKGVSAAGLKIAVSNNGINASNAVMLFITYDSVCQECNTTTGCRLKADACFISGHCHAQNASHPYDWCQQCLPHISTTSWLERKDNQRPVFTTSNVLYAFRGKQLRVQLRATDPESRTVRYSIAQKESFGASLTERGLFTWTKTTNDSKTFLFKVTDECGAHSVLNSSVVIKECPCQNSGVCYPDYRYFDGAGNFTCSCPAQYTGALCDVDIDECAVSKPCNNGKCKNEQPGYSCTCFAGYTGDLCQTEVDECASSPCFLGVACSDMVAAYSCGPCPNGYSGDGKNCTRTDGKVDECVKNPQICNSNANCVYNNGSYMCQCIDGYTGNGKNICTDVNECIQTVDICHLNGNCSNTDGSYSCECSKGYTGDGKLNCSDIDECTVSPNVCIQNALCFNSAGSYQCQCSVGYSGDGYSNCTDINECHNIPSVCHQYASCSNSEGSYSCQCKSGYSGDGKINCTDIDECVDINNACHHQANCGNTPGSFLCQCRSGFSGDGKLSCADINECDKSPSVCHPLSRCSNIEGSFACHCKQGYTGDGNFNCSDIDECSPLSSVCHQDAKCSNSIGSYYCECNQGFFGDGIQKCTENQPPKFTTPSVVYAILNQDFQILIKAEDPESEELTFTLLNATLNTVKIEEQQLKISNLKKNITVIIQVQDRTGAKNILVLQVRTMECPCNHNGVCYQNKTIPYPVHPSDYLCKCEQPYTGYLCDIRPNPCDEQPCYPGLKCSLVQTDFEEFACEKCPRLFKGDGEKCELDPTQEKSPVKSEMVLTNHNWDEQLNIITSKLYKKLVNLLTIEINELYKNHDGFIYVIIKGFRQGSVIVEFELIFTEKVEDPLKPLKDMAETGRLGNMTFQVKNVKDKETSATTGTNKIFGLDKTIFFVIIGVAVILILMISFAIYHRIKRHQRHGMAKLTPKTVGTSDAKAKGIAFQAAADVDLDYVEGGREEIDLKVFDNEAVHLDDEGVEEVK